MEVIYLLKLPSLTLSELEGRASAECGKCYDSNPCAELTPVSPCRTDPGVPVQN